MLQYSTGRLWGHSDERDLALVKHMILALLIASASALQVQPLLRSPPPLLSARARAVAPRMTGLDVAAATTLLVAADDGGFNPLFLLLPLPWVGGIGFLIYQQKTTNARRKDPANESRLGYTVQEMENMEELARLRLQSDIKDWEEACAKSEELGTPKPNGLTWLANKKSGKEDYFGGGKNEGVTMI